MFCALEFARISPGKMSFKQAWNILDTLGRSHYKGTNPSHVPTSIRALTPSLDLTSFTYELSGPLGRETEMVGRKEIEYLFQALFNIPGLAGMDDDYFLMEAREAVIIFRLQLQIFLRQAFRKYWAIESTLSNEEK